VPYPLTATATTPAAPPPSSRAGKFFISKLSGLARDINADMPLEAKNHSSLIYTLLQVRALLS